MSDSPPGRRTRRHLSVAVALLTLLAAGCGGGEESGPVAEDTAEAGSTPSPSAPVSESPSAPASESPSAAESAAARSDAPSCDQVWVTGETIPRGYDGCNRDGAFVEVDLLGCSSGQRLARFDDRYYGVLGGLVREAESSFDDDRAYRRSVASCRA